MGGGVWKEDEGFNIAQTFNLLLRLRRFLVDSQLAAVSSISDRRILTYIARPRRISRLHRNVKGSIARCNGVGITSSPNELRPPASLAKSCEGSKGSS